MNRFVAFLSLVGLATLPVRAFELEGFVYGQDGMPVDGATVTAHALASPATPVATAKTEKGRFVFTNLPELVLDLEVRADGMPEATLRVTPYDTQVHITLNSVVEDNALQNASVVSIVSSPGVSVLRNTYSQMTHIAESDTSSPGVLLEGNQVTEAGSAILGVHLQGDGNTLRNNDLRIWGFDGSIGVHLTGDGNVIDDNNLQGAFYGFILSGDSNTITGNRVHGTVIGMSVGGNGSTIGGPSQEARNFFYGNQQGHTFNEVGLDLSGTNHHVENNWFGISEFGTVAPNENGLRVTGGTGHVITRNVFANSDARAVWLQSGATVSQNMIYGNGLAGISGTTPGTAHPQLTSAVTNDTTLFVTGTLSSAANTTYTLEFFANGVCHASGRGEGLDYLGSMSVTTDAGGNPAFTAQVDDPFRPSVITATATNTANGHTSEFSNCAPTVMRSPVIGSIGPDGGPVGTTVDIRGHFLGDATSVTFGGTPAQFTVVDDQHLQAIAPNGGTVTVTTPYGTATTGNAGFIIRARRPGITSIEPNEGHPDGGTRVTIHGTDFQPGVTFEFGGLPALSVESISPERATAITPPHAAGSVSVAVRNPDGQYTILGNAFTYTTCARPQITGGVQETGIMRGTSTTLEATAQGPAIEYQWYVDAGDAWQEIDGATSPSLEVAPDETTSYQLRVSNVCATVTHTVRVSVCGAAVATAQHPRVDPGQTTTVSVLADTPAVHGVQWFELRDGALIGVQGVSGATFTTPALQRTTIYLARVSTPCGIIESSPAVVVVGEGKRRAVRH